MRFHVTLVALVLFVLGVTANAVPDRRHLAPRGAASGVTVTVTKKEEITTTITKKEEITTSITVKVPVSSVITKKVEVTVPVTITKKEEVTVTVTPKAAPSGKWRA